MTKIISYTALLYGKDYLGYALKSIIDTVDEAHILYALNPSHGHASSAVNPDTKDELRAIAEQAAGSKLRWHEGAWTQENQQREAIYQYADDADVIIILDADEVWRAETHELLQSEIGWQGKYIRIPFYHQWRSFKKAIMHDPAAPPRIIFPKSQHPDWAMNAHQHQAIVHFGYAQRAAIVEYKMQIHGHLNEFRHDVDWYKDIFLNKERTTDLHPVGSQYWSAELVNPDDYMPALMKSHPWYSKDFIE